MAGLNGQQPTEVHDASGHGAFGAELADELIGAGQARYAALRGAQAKDVVPARGVSEAPHEVRPIGQGQQAKCERHGGAS